MPEPFDPQSLNRYSYVRNSPTNRIDPTGNFDFWGGLTDFFTVGVPNFFGSIPFLSSIPSFATSAFDSFYSSLVAPIVSAPGAIAEIWSPNWGVDPVQVAGPGAGSPASTSERESTPLSK